MSLLFNAQQFYQDHGINYLTDGHKHCQRGWIQIPCPFCTGNPGWHLGYNRLGGFYTCWRCGFHSISEVVKFHTMKSWTEVKTIINRYKTYDDFKFTVKKKKKTDFVELPVYAMALAPPHKKYLKERKFNPKKIEKEWGILGTRQFGPYAYRIIAPIYYNNVLVSYQGRDITNKQELKYKACPQDQEIIDHKQIFYGLDKVPGKTAVLVEGCFDVWRLGPGAISSFGIKLKKNQIRLLYELFDKVYILFDDDPQAIEEGTKIYHALQNLEVDVEFCEMEDDPADGLTDDEAQEFMKSIM